MSPLVFLIASTEVPTRQVVGADEAPTHPASAKAGLVFDVTVCPVQIIIS